MVSAGARGFRELGKTAHWLYNAGSVLVYESMAFAIAAPFIAWTPLVGVPLAVLAAAFVTFLCVLVIRDESRGISPRSLASYEQLPYAWGQMVGVVAACAIISAGVLGASLVAGDAFYEQSAQVIPVLLLTFAVEQHFFSSIRREETQREAVQAFMLVILAAALAEVLVMASLATGATWVRGAATIAVTAAVPASLALISVSAFVNGFRLRSEDTVSV